MYLYYISIICRRKRLKIEEHFYLTEESYNPLEDQNLSSSQSLVTVLNLRKKNVYSQYWIFCRQILRNGMWLGTSTGILRSSTPSQCGTSR